MDDRRFDSLVRALAEGKSRRSVLKGFLGLGGAAAVGGTLLEGGTDAARRPTPTPTPVRCPGNQTPVNGVCTCPASAPFECGPDCCTSEAGGPPTPTHSECCDNACCFGTCYGEELCCPTNDRSAGEFPIPPTHKICESAVNGTECCELDAPCCEVDGCCDTVCWAGNAFCCSQEAFCPGGGSVEDICCVNVGDQLFACCNGGTDARFCYDTSVDGACCTDADCGDPCLVCNAATNICEPRCDAENEVCCTGLPGPGVCITGECCSFDDCGEGRACCDAASGTLCVDQTFCPNSCSAESPCIGCSTCIDGLCFEGCAEGEECCWTEAGDQCFPAGTCGPNGCVCDGGLDCCVIDDEFTCVDLSQPGACCTDADCGDPCQVCNLQGLTCEALCGAGQNCCVEDEVAYCTAAPCECDRMCSDAGLDCCTINNVFAGCYDRSAEEACCTAGECEHLNEFDDCLVGACTDFACEQLSSCTAGQFCCGGNCSDTPCAAGEAGDACLEHSQCRSALCCEERCCADGERCLGGQCGNENDGGQPGDICVEHSHCLSEMCCGGRCCASGLNCCSDQCSELECE
jgi:hypothetical protein